MADVLSAYPKDRIAVREVGLRDGLQLTGSYPSTEKKIEWIDREYSAGIRYFEVGSFLPASRMPQFADVREIINAVNRHAGNHSIALVLNERGAGDALQTDVGEITVVISASAAHNEANARRTQQQSLADLASMVRLRNETVANPIISVGIATAFGCSLSGRVEVEDVIRLVDRCFDAGVDMVGLADTVGYAGPRQVGDLCDRVTRRFGELPYVIHLHDTRGMGMANASAAMDAGCHVFDASLAGLGGCPFAPGATGNIVLEDLIYLIETKGFSTNIDLEKIIEIRAILQHELPGVALNGELAKCGTPNRLEWRATVP